MGAKSRDTGLLALIAHAREGYSRFGSVSLSDVDLEGGGVLALQRG